MSFLVLLLVIWVEKFSALRQRVQQDEWWLKLMRSQCSKEDRSPWSILLILVVLPAVSLALVLWLIQPLAYSLPTLLVHMVVVVYSLGRGDLQSSLGPFRDAWRRGDREAALHVAERDLQIEPKGPDSLLPQVQGYLLWQAYQSFFAVIFWYVLLGPVLALVYRLIALIIEHTESASLQKRALQIRHALDWLPVRVLATSFALVGNFVAVSRETLHELLNWDIPARKILFQSGRAAIDILVSRYDEMSIGTLDQLWSLLVRSAVVWYALLAIWVLLL